METKTMRTNNAVNLDGLASLFISFWCWPLTTEGTISNRMIPVSETACNTAPFQNAAERRDFFLLAILVKQFIIGVF